MKKDFLAQKLPWSLAVLVFLIEFLACSSDGTDDPVIDGDTDADEETITELHAAFEAFNPEATTIYLDGSQIVIETTACPTMKRCTGEKATACTRKNPT